MTSESSAQSTAEEVVHRDAAQNSARAGIAVHGLVYVLIGALAIALALGGHRGETDSHGALDELSAHTGGWTLLLAIAIGLAVYALWQLSRVFVTGSGAQERAEAAFSVVFNGALSASAIHVLASGHASNQSRTQQDWTARVMGHTDGRWLVALVGAIVIIVGGVISYRGLKRSFADDLDLRRADPVIEKLVLTLGLVGTVARGVVVALAGVLLVVAAVQFNPSKARGLDGALRALRDTSLGPWLLLLVAAGLVMFGVYGLFEARFRRL